MNARYQSVLVMVKSLHVTRALILMNVSVANEEGCNHDGDDVAGSLPCDLFSRRFRNEAFAGAGQAGGHTLG